MNHKKGLLMTVLIILAVFLSSFAIYEFQVFNENNPPKLESVLSKDREGANILPSYLNVSESIVIEPANNPRGGAKSGSNRGDLNPLANLLNPENRLDLASEDRFLDVVVMLNDDMIPEITKDSLLDVSSKIRMQQDKVLSELDSEDEFSVKYRYNTINGFAARITREELEELKQNPNVEAIYEDEIFSLALTESVPLINAPPVWNSGFMGNGSVVCVVDTGIDYRHQDLGGCTDVYQLNGGVYPYNLESPHPYENNFSYTWTITMPGFNQIAVHFSNLSVETGYDYIHILDSNGTRKQSFNGWYDDVWTVSIPGDTIKIQLVSDEIINRSGFIINQILNGTANFSLQNCGKVIDGYDFVNNDNDPRDDQYHGTHVAGIVAADGDLKGVAPGAKLLALKVCNTLGGCYGSAMMAAVDWCNTKKSEYNIVATTLSIGGGGPYGICPSYMNAVFNASNNLGIPVTVASGNNGFSTGISNPACSPFAISVGSTTKSDVISSFTNTGETLDVLAPGSNIFSAIPNKKYGYLSGTSMATPHVAGAIALLKQYKPLASARQIEFALKKSGIMITDPDNGLSFPRINVNGAYDFLGCSQDIDCGTDSAEFSETYCKNEKVYQNRTDYDVGCFNEICDQVISKSEQMVENCEYGCDKGICLSPIPRILSVCKNGSCNYTKIQEALNESLSGDKIILLDQEIYNEQLVWTTNNLTLDCQGATIDGESISNRIYSCFGLGENILGTAGIFACNKNNLSISNCKIKNFKGPNAPYSSLGFGIFIVGGSFVQTVNNTVQNNNLGITPVSVNTMRIEKNSILDNDVGGLYLLDSEYGEIFNNVILSNGFNYSSGGGVMFESSANINVERNLFCPSNYLDFVLFGGSSLLGGSGNKCSLPNGWNDDGTTGCSYSCDDNCFSNLDCGIDGSIGAPFCSGKDVFQDYKMNFCNNPGEAFSFCSYNTTPQLKEPCRYGCENALCMKPDLAVSDLSIQRLNGKTVTLAFTIENIGNAIAELVYWMIDTNSTAESLRRIAPISLEPGADTRAYMMFTYPDSGTFNPRAIVDPDNLINESDEGNNEQSIFISV